MVLRSTQRHAKIPFRLYQTRLTLDITFDKTTSGNKSLPYHTEIAAQTKVEPPRRNTFSLSFLTHRSSLLRKRYTERAHNANLGQSNLSHGRELVT